MAIGSNEVGILLGMVQIGLIGFLLTAFWIWMTVDAAMNEPSGGNDKIIWIIIIVLVGWLGALIYYFARRPKQIAETGR